MELFGRNQISASCSFAVLIICIVSLCGLVIFNALSYEGFFIRGLNWIYAYQQAQPYEAVKVIYNIIAFYSGVVGVGITIATYVVLVKRKLKILVHIAYLMYCTYLMALLKQSFQ